MFMISIPQDGVIVMSTIYKIAKRTGFSSSTVARALREDGVCSPETREAIQKVANEIGYVPNRAARTLRNQRTEKIMFCIPDIYNSFYFGMIRGASEVFERHGFFALLCHTGGDPKNELRMLDNLKSRLGDGMIFVSFDFSKKLIETINETHMPVVLTNSTDAGDFPQAYDTVCVNTTEGTRMATNHLISQGHRHIGYIGGDVLTKVGRERLAGYLSAMEAAGLTPSPGYRSNGAFTIEGGTVCGMQLLCNNPMPTAVVAANDLMAIGMMRACEMRGIQIPSDMALIGMDNSELSQFIRPSLSSIIMKEDDIGRLSATLLMDRILNGRTEPKNILLKPDIIIRESSMSR